jgi:Glycosyltransferase family 87
MIKTSNRYRDYFVTERIIDGALFVLLGAILTILAILYSGYLTNGAPLCADFVGFYIAGRMGSKGNLTLAYDVAQMNSELDAFHGKQCHISWVHPPTFGLIATFLSYFPIGLSYIIFMSSTLLGYAYVLRRLSENLVNYNIVRIAFLPAIVGVMLQGQTGFLTATLVGLFCFGVIAERTQAGIPLGLMIIKPHLALGIAFFCLIEKKWGVICVAGITSAVLVLIATFWFGANVWESFAIGIAEIGRRLADGDLPLAKMTSVYASLSSAGVSHTIASSLQILSFLICLSVIFWAHCLKLETKMLMGISIFCSLGLAPYVFYYDWTILAVGFALLLPALSEVTNLAQRIF